MKKRLTAALLCVVLCFAMLGTAYAADPPSVSVSGKAGQTYATITASGLDANTTYAMCSIVQGNTLMALFNMTTDANGSYTGNITTGVLTQGAALKVSIPDQANGSAGNAVASGSATVADADTGGNTGGGGGGGGGVSSYTLTFDTNGGSAIAKVSKTSGTTIDLTDYKTTRTGYTFAGWFSDSELTKSVTSVKLTSNTTVYAKWTANGTNPFNDVAEGAYYYDAVLWAVENGVTSGTSATTFAPNATCTRAQTVTFLWRANGSPKPTGTVNPFSDVSADAYYYKAVLWAVEQGITVGTTDTTFAPDATCTRAQVVTFQWRAAGSPAASGSSFSDVPADAYYAQAVAWAVSEGITSGTGNNQFSPSNNCTRAQIVTFLYRQLG